MIARIHAFSRRFLMMLSGEMLQSAFGFALNILLLRALSAERYGVFAIVVLIGAFGILYMRALVGVPACTYIPQSRRPSIAVFYNVMFGSAAIVAALIWALVAGVSLAVWQPAGAIAGGTFAGAWALRSYVRMALFAQGRARLATASDFAFTISAAALCFPMIMLVPSDRLLEVVLFALTTAHLIGAGLSFVVLREPIRFSLSRAVRTRLLKLLPSMTWSIVSVTAANIQGQGAVLLLAIIAGPAAYAPIAATIAFFSPLRLAAAALSNMTQPDFASTMARKGPRAVIGTLLISTGMIAVVCGLYGLMMLWAFPALAVHAFPRRFDAEPLNLIAFLVWCIATVAVLYSVPRTLLETVQKYRENAVLAAVGGVVGLPVVVLLLIFASPAWSLTGILVSECVILAGSWIAALPVIYHIPGRARDKRHSRWFTRYFASPGTMPSHLAAREFGTEA
ncbi:MAG: hypothetical protein P4L76_05370 [Beijerinckiaceae bacterium]|nr:hypothetical protein [Beijerinckiaceae bacterium]